MNPELEAKARSLAGFKGYGTILTTTPDGPPITAEFVIATYARLLNIGKSFRMSKHDLQARPIYHHRRELIEAHLNIVFAALAITHWLEATTGWSIKSSFGPPAATGPSRSRPTSARTPPSTIYPPTAVH